MAVGAKASGRLDATAGLLKTLPEPFVVSITVPVALISSPSTMLPLLAVVCKVTAFAVIGPVVLIAPAAGLLLKLKPTTFGEALRISTALPAILPTCTFPVAYTFTLPVPALTGPDAVIFPKAAKLTLVPVMLFPLELMSDPGALLCAL